MRLYVAGGCKEHGRNCFLLEKENYNIMVDCGVKDAQEESERYPALHREQIEKTKYLFITHSHKDHTGALSWLYDKGFKGTVILSDDTFHQMRRKPLRSLNLTRKDTGYLVDLEEDLSFAFGRSGHCSGSLWYLLNSKDQKILFTGDYCEHSSVYVCDPIRNVEADLVVMDCAYGNDSLKSKNHAQHFVDVCMEIIRQGKNIVFPVPLFGRSLDILYHMDVLSDRRISADKRVLYTYFYSKDFWCKELSSYPSSKFHLYDQTLLNEQAFYIIADPQLRKQENREFVSNLLEKGGVCIFTGHLEEHSYGLQLVEEKKAVFHRYYVHQNYDDVENLIGHNSFKKVLLHHYSGEIQIENHTNILCPGVGCTVDLRK